MFLHQLSGTEKKAFVELAHVIALSDGVMNEQERQLLGTYNREMGINLTIEDLEEPSLEEIIATFTSDTSRRISFIEALAIALTDGVYDDEEKSNMNRLREAFGFSMDYYEEVKVWLKAINTVYQQGLRLIS